MYHGFTDEENHEGIENYQGKHIDIEIFRSQIKYIKKNYNRFWGQFFFFITIINILME